MRIDEYSPETQRLWQRAHTLMFAACIPTLIAAAIVLSLDDFSRVLWAQLVVWPLFASAAAISYFMTRTVRAFRRAGFAERKALGR